MMATPKTPLTIRRITESKLFFPFLVLAIILLFDAIWVPSFFSIQVRNGNLYGSLIDVVRNASTVMLLSLGMTLVLATGGVDLSGGAIIYI
jgi:simple sugar transport system permease protein